MDKQRPVHKREPGRPSPMVLGRHWVSVIALLVLASCSSSRTADPRAPDGEPFAFKGLFKTDIDAAMEVFVREELELIKKLTRKLYLRNPRELKKAPGLSIERRIQEIHVYERVPAGFEELSGLDALRRSLDSDYEQDRVFAFVYGLRRMIFDSFDEQDRFYLLDRLDPQKLYNCARNIEIAVWKIKVDRDVNGQLLMLTNSLAEEEPLNLSFERLFGKLIGLQDIAAEVISDRSNRVIRYVVQSIVFLPV